MNNSDFLGDVKKISDGKPTLRSVCIDIPPRLDSEDQSPSFIASLGLILSHNRSTLESVAVDVVTFGALSKIQKMFSPLENVKELEFFVLEAEDIGIHTNLLPACCQQIFPSVSFSALFHDFEGQVAEAQETQETVAWPAVTEIVLDRCILSESRLAELGALFSNLRHLTTVAPHNEEGEIPYQLIWKTWPLLENLEVGSDYFKLKIK